MQRVKSGKIRSRTHKTIPLDTKGVFSRGMFGNVLLKYQNSFGNSSILVLKFDEIVKENSEELLKLKKFLNLEDDLPLTLPKSNPSVGGLKKNWTSRSYKKYLHPLRKRGLLPSLRVFSPIVEKFSEKVKVSEAVKLTPSQIVFLKETYREDEKVFQKITGWSYWDLKM